MQKIVIAILFLLCIFPGVPAQKDQERKDFPYFDKQTYAAYLKKDWNRVISLGKESLLNGYDFYYLRLRMGIAYFSKRNYMQAIHHFRQAFLSNQNDPVVLEYLYYCYLYTGRQSDLQSLLYIMPENLLEKVGLDKNYRRGIRNINVSYDYFFNKDYPHMSNYAAPGVSAGDGWQTMDYSGQSFSVLFDHAAGKNVLIDYGYRYLNKTRFYFYQLTGNDYENDRNIFVQHLLYGKFTFRLGYGASLKLSGNYLNLRPQVEENTWFNGGMRRLWVTNPLHDWTLSFSLQQSLLYFSMYAGTGAAGMNNLWQLQPFAGFIFYPLGNEKLYFGSRFSYLWQGYTMDHLTGNLIIEPLLGIQVAVPLWLEVFGSAGNYANFQDMNGWLLYNNFDPVKNSYGGSLIYSWYKKKIVFTLTALHSDMTSYYFYRQENTLMQTNAIDYHMFNLNLKIKWNF